MAIRSERKITYLVASDVNPRDGIGLETYIDGELVMEIFRDDAERRTYVRLFAKEVDFDVLEAAIEKYKERIDVNYVQYPDA